MSMSKRRPWRTRRCSPAQLLARAGGACRTGFEQLETRVLLSDPGSTFDDAQELILDGDGQATYDDQLPDTDDIDMYKFSVSSPDFITLLADAINAGDPFDDRVDTQMTVYDFQGNVIGSSTDSGPLSGGTPIDAWFGFVPTSSHLDPDTGEYTYFVAVSAENPPLNDAPGNYTFRVDAQSTLITPTGDDSETTQNGTITRALEDIVYRIETGSGSEWDSVATANGKADSAILDSRIDIYNSAGERIAFDSQAGRLTNAFVVFNSEPDSTFYVRVRSDEFAPGTPRTGGFTLGLDLIGHEIDLDPVWRTGLGGGTGGATETDMFTFVAQASGPAIISAAGAGLPPLPNPALTLYDADGQFLAFNDRFFGDSPQIEALLEGGERYFVLVDGFTVAFAGGFSVFVEANHTFDEQIGLDDHANSLDYPNATPMVWSDWQVAVDNTLGQGPLVDHSLVSLASATGRIHRGSDTDLFVFVPPVDMLGEYQGNIGAEVDTDMDGQSDRDGNAAMDGAAIPWYETYRPSTRVEIQVQAFEPPGGPQFTFLTPLIRVYDSNGDLVYQGVEDTINDAAGMINPGGSLDPARYFGDLDVGAVGVDYFGGASPFEGVFSLEVWGGEPYYIEVSATSGSGRYNMWVSADGMPNPSDASNWQTISSRNPIADDSFTGIADDTGTYIVSGITSGPNNFSNSPLDFANAQRVTLDQVNGGFAGPVGSSNGYIDGSANFERAFFAGDADLPTFWTGFPAPNITDPVGATLLAGKDETGLVFGQVFNNIGVAVLRESGLAGIMHPLDKDLYTFRAAADGFAEVRINTTQLNDWHSEWIADGAGELVDSEADDGGFVWNDDMTEPEGDFVEPVNFFKEKTYNSILDSALRVFNNDFEQIGFANDNDAMIGQTERTYIGAHGERTFHKRDARVVFPITRGEVYYVQVESGQAEAYQAWQADNTLPVAWQHMIGSYEMLIHTVPTLNNDDHVNSNFRTSTTLGIDETTGQSTIRAVIDNNDTNPFDADLFNFTSPVSGPVTVTAARAQGSSLIPEIAIFEVIRTGDDTYDIVQRAGDTATSGGTVTIDLDVTKGRRYLVQVFGAGSTEGAYDLSLAGFTVQDDHADWLDFQDATEIELLDFLGSAQASGSIEGNGDTDMFKFSVGDFTDATITVTGQNGFNPYVEVFEVSVDPFGNPIMLKIARNDDISDDNTDSRVTIGLTPDRVSGLTGEAYPYYFVLVRGSDIQRDEGDYTVAFSITKTDDHADEGQFDFATPIPVDRETGQGQITGTIEIPSDTDLFRFTALAGGIARVTVSRPTGSTFLPKLSIIDGEGNELAPPSDGAIPGTVQTSVVRGQVYYVLVEPSSIANQNQQTGDYTVALAIPPLDDYPNAGEWTIAHSLTLDADTGDAVLGTDEPGNPLNPRLEVVGDTDLFTFNTIATGNVVVTFAPLDESIIAIRPRLTIFDAERAEVQTVTATNPGEPVSIVLTDTTPNQRFYILVRDALGNRTGEYKLSVDGEPGSGGGGGGGGSGQIDFDNASDIELDPFNADGSASGVIARSGERDLYTFTAPSGGDIYVQLITPRGSLFDGKITVLDAASEEAVLTSDATGIPGVDAAVRFDSAGPGTQYWVIVEAIGGGVGSYTLRIDAEPEVFRAFFPEGFTGPSISEFVSLTNPNDFDITYSIILRYETGERDQVIVSNQTLEAGSRGGVTISDRGRGSPVGARIAPYSVEVQAVGGPIGAAMGHYDFDATTGDAFTSTLSPAWSLARLERSTGNVNDFVLYYNPHDFDVNVTLTAYANGEAVEVTTTLGALRRGGLNLDQVTSLPTGVFGAVVTAEPVNDADRAAFQGIVVSQTHFDLVGNSGFGLIADPLAGSLSGAVPNLVQGGGSDAEVVLFNPNSFVATVQLRGQYVRAFLPDLARNINIPAGGTIRLTGQELGMIDAQPLGLRYTSNFPITVMGNQSQLGDADASAAASQAGTGWFFGDAFMNSALAGESYFETLGVYNPADTFTEVSVTLLFVNGTSETLRLNVRPNGFAEVRLHEIRGSDFVFNADRPENFDPNEILGRPGLSFFSVFATAPSPIAVSFSHYDLFLQGGWTSQGAPLGPLNPISTIL
jgi:hypothetical protein